MKNCVGVKGTFSAVLTKKSGETAEYKKHNMILDSGFAFMAACMTASEGRPAPVSKIAVGLDDTASQAAMPGLVDELAAREAIATYNADTKSITVEAYFGGDVVGAIKEAGVCNDAGIFLDRSTFDVSNKGEDDELTVRFIISLSEVEG